MAPSSPEISVHIKAPNFELITPEAASYMPQERVFSHGGVKVVKISPTMVMKYGDSVDLSEARTLEFVRHHTLIPVPRVYAAYTHGPSRSEMRIGVQNMIPTFFKISWRARL
jgi:hypothetical protein